MKKRQRGNIIIHQDKTYATQTNVKRLQAGIYKGMKQKSNNSIEKNPQKRAIIRRMPNYQKKLKTFTLINHQGNENLNR